MSDINNQICDAIGIIVDKKIKDDVLLNIYKDAGLETKGQGIVFSLPVEDMMGLNINEEETK